MRENKAANRMGPGGRTIVLGVEKNKIAISQGAEKYYGRWKA